MRILYVLAIVMIGIWASADTFVLGPGCTTIVYYKEGNDMIVRNCGKSTPTITKMSTVGMSPSIMMVDEYGDSMIDHRDGNDTYIKKCVNTKTRSDCTGGLENRAPAASFNNALQAANNQASFAFLEQYDASRPECGTDGSLDGVPGEGTGKLRGISWFENILFDSAVAIAAEAIHGLSERVEDCKNKILPSVVPYSNPKNGHIVNWILVSRKRDPSTGKFYEVWQDSHTKLFWGDRLDSSSDQYHAQAKCSDDEGKRASAGLMVQKPELPAKKDIVQAIDDGVIQSLPNMRGWFWSSTVNKGSSGDGAWGLDGVQRELGNDSRSNQDRSVRCVWR